MKIGELLRQRFGAPKVPDRLTVQQADELIAVAKEQVRLGQADEASKRSLLEQALATAALDPEDARQQRAVEAATLAHRKAEDAARLAAALLKGAQQKLVEARAREDVAAAEGHLADVRDYAKIALDAAEKIDASLGTIALALANDLVPALAKLGELERAAVSELPMMQRSGLAALFRLRIELALGLHRTGTGFLTYGQTLQASDLRARVHDVASLAVASARDALPAPAEEQAA
jgi:hypothetical protein